MRIITATLFAAALTLGATAQDATSPACDLLTLEEATAAFGEAATEAGGSPETMGASGCGWMGSVKYGSIAFSLAKGEAFGGGTADQAYDALKQGMASMGAVEELSGVGDKAFLVPVTGSTDSFSLGVVKNGALLSINTTGVAKDAVVTVATAAAGRM